MTRRIIMFIEKDGTQYATTEFNGDKAEFELRCQHFHCQDSCDKDWAEIEPIFFACKTLGDFICANEQAQSFYHSFLPNQETILVRQLEDGEDVTADEILVIYEEPLYGKVAGKLVCGSDEEGNPRQAYTVYLDKNTYGELKSMESLPEEAFTFEGACQHDEVYVSYSAYFNDGYSMNIYGGAWMQGEADYFPKFYASLNQDDACITLVVPESTILDGWEIREDGMIFAVNFEEVA